MYKNIFSIILSCTILISFPANAEINPNKIYIAESKKTKTYISDGVITGGDQAIHHAEIKDIRRATNSGFERIVIDLEIQDPKISIQRPPYFQIAVSSPEKRIVVSIWGQPNLTFTPRKLLESFKKSSLIQNIHLHGKVEEEVWTFSIQMKTNFQVEVFELSHPLRLIMDIQPKKG